MNASEWLVWYWRYGGYYIERHDTLDEALEHGWQMSRGGDDAVLGHIEGPDGVVDPAEDFERRAAAERAEMEAEQLASPDPTHAIKITGPDGKNEAWWDTYANAEAAEAAAAELRPRFGSRVLVGTNPWNFPTRPRQTR